MRDRTIRPGDGRECVRCRIPSTGSRITEACEVTINLVGIETSWVEAINRVILDVRVEVEVISVSQYSFDLIVFSILHWALSCAWKAL
jgi:hypothetical protein